jgi:hypothetical protein
VIAGLTSSRKRGMGREVRWTVASKWSTAREKSLAEMLESEPPTVKEPANDQDLSASTHARARESGNYNKEPLQKESQKPVERCFD